MGLTPGLVIAAGVVWPVVCITVVVLRFAARKIKNERIGVDDWLMLPALVSLP